GRALGDVGDAGVLRYGDVLGVGAVHHTAEHVVAVGKARDVLAHGHDAAGEVRTADGVARSEDARHQPSKDGGDAGKVGGAQPAVAVGDGARMNANEHVVGAWRGAVDFGQLQDVGGAVAGVDDGSHGGSPRRGVGVDPLDPRSLG